MLLLLLLLLFWSPFGLRPCFLLEVCLSKGGVFWLRGIGNWLLGMTLVPGFECFWFSSMGFVGVLVLVLRDDGFLRKRDSRKRAWGPRKRMLEVHREGRSKKER